MKNIIEKLGIKLNEDGCHQFKSEEIYKSVKGAAPEMLEVLIEIAIDAPLDSSAIEPMVSKIIEKATGKTWEEIKELLEKSK